MADAKQCDVCKKLYSSKEWRERVMSADKLYLTRFDEHNTLRTLKKYDVCPECLKNLLAYLDKEE